jgi:hypothetical protein
MFVLALAVMGCSETLGAGGSGGSGATGGTGGTGGDGGDGGMGGGGTGGMPECETAEDCDDDNECTTDACDAALASCKSTPVADGGLCGTEDQWGGLLGACYAGSCNFVPVSVSVGPRKVVFDWTTDRCADLDLPDQPARFVRRADGELLLFDGNFPAHYVTQGTDFDSLERICDSPVFVSANLPTPDSYEPPSVLQLERPIAKHEHGVWKERGSSIRN